MEKRILFLLCLLWLPQLGWSQQMPQYSQYMLNPLLLNPAISGTDNYIDVRLGARNQWMGLEGAPTSYYLTGHMPLGRMDFMTTPTSFRPQPATTSKQRAKWRPQRRNTSSKPRAHHGVGLVAQVDQAAGLKRTDVQATYAYHQPVTANIKLAAGIAVGVSRHSLNYELLTFTNPGDLVLHSQDYSRTLPTLGLGLMAYSNRFYGGVSLAQILPTPFSYRDSKPEIPAKQQRHLFLHGGYRFQAGPDVSVMPSVVVKYASPSPAMLDLNTKVHWRDDFWVAGTYRHNDAVVLMAGFQMKKFLHFSYAYDMTTSSLRNYSSGSHEIVLGVMIRNRSEVYSPSQYW